MSEDIHQDRAFQYGDGMFTTMHVACGRVALWSLHKHRLQNDCARLGLTLDLASLTEQVHAAAEKLADGVLKVHISSGCGGRGYQRPAGQSAVWRLSDFSVPAQYACWQKQGIAADISPVTLGLQPLLAGIKHINRLEQVLVKEQITLDDAIVCDMQGYVTEASASNVFWYADGQWYTPSLDNAGVAGVYRAFILSTLEQAGKPVITGKFTISDLKEASAVFLCNALMHIVPLNRIQFDDAEVRFDCGPVWTLQQQMNEAYEREHETPD